MTCAGKLTCSQLRLPHETKQEKTKTLRERKLHRGRNVTESDSSITPRKLNVYLLGTVDPGFKSGFSDSWIHGDARSPWRRKMTDSGYARHLIG